MIAEIVENNLPFLRRYARAVAGSTERGDLCIGEALIKIASGAAEKITDRVDVYHALDAELRQQIESQMSIDSRRALLLSTVEDFGIADVAYILDTSVERTADLLADAELELMTSLSKTILIIEDEPLIAADLQMLCEELRHTVCGVAPTAARAIGLYETHPVGLVLADVRLADGSSGVDAVKAMNLPDSVPVIYITAYPKDLLQGLKDEPAYLIAKPFSDDIVKTVISQALLSVK